MNALLLIPIVVLFLLLLVAMGVVIGLLVRRSRADSEPARRPGASPGPRADPFTAADDAGGDPRSIKVGDMVEYLTVRYFVRGTLRLREGGFTWSEHFLDDVAGTKRWISVEEDPDLQVVLWTEHPADGLSPDAARLTVNGVQYQLEEHGTAGYESEGATGVGSSGRVEYVDYEGPNGHFLAFVRLGGGAWECVLGVRVP